MNFQNKEILITTQQLATILQVKPQTVRAGVSRTGDYVGLRPLKLPNGRVRWFLNEVEKLCSQIPAKS